MNSRYIGPLFVGCIVLYNSHLTPNLLLLDAEEGKFLDIEEAC